MSLRTIALFLSAFCLIFVIPAGAAEDVAVSNVSSNRPFRGIVHSLPGRIEAEDYDEGGEGVAYHDNDPENQGGSYRTDGVDIQPTTDVGEGYNVGWTLPGEWLEYTVNVPDGSAPYIIGLRVASISGGLMRLRMGGLAIGLIEIPNTGGWQKWQTVTLPAVSIQGGATNQTLWLEVFGGSVNINWLEISRIQLDPRTKNARIPYNDPTEGLGSWIWSDKCYNNQVCQFWRSFEIPSSSTIKHAVLFITADDEFTLSLDGLELGRGGEWQDLFEFDLSNNLKPGRHILAVSALNDYGDAGVILGLRVVLADGRVLEVKSDESWSVVPERVIGWEKKTKQLASWPAAKVVLPLGSQPKWFAPRNVIVMPMSPAIKVYFWQTGWFQITLLSICGLVILISLRLMMQLVLHQKEQGLLRQERARIARDIHDDIGARMTELVLHGELAQNEVPSDSEAQGQLNLICEKARGLLSAMDEILWAVNPQRDTLRDFAIYVINYAQEFLEHTQIQCLFEVDPEISAAPFNLPLRRSLLMAIKEAFNNTVKHSQATEMVLKIQWLGERLVVVVQDNGNGFDAATAKPGRNGLGNMIQRMKELDGTCHVVSLPGKGCRVELSIPLRHSGGHRFAWIWNPKQLSQQLNEPKNSNANEPSQNHDPTKC